MINVAFIFPGQGAQKVGMGKDFYDTSSDARKIFDQADAIIPGLNRAIFEGPAETLTSTAFCQPAIYTFSCAALASLAAHPKFKNLNLKFTAGLSLGEYSALMAAGVFSFENGLRLVQKRSLFMEEATRLESGKMAAVIGFEVEPLKAICAQTGAQVANFNAPGQIVITGHAAKVEEASRVLKEQGAKRVLPLDVSGAFHSTLMQPAADQFAAVVAATSLSTPKLPVISNVDGKPKTSSEEVRQCLVRQITSSVQWIATIEHMVANGVTQFIEIGPGNVLKGLVRRIHPEAVVHNIETPQDIENLSF